MIAVACPKPVRVIDRATGKEYELVPVKVWELAPRGRRSVKIGLFKNPDTGRFFRARVPDDYPICS